MESHAKQKSHALRRGSWKGKAFAIPRIRPNGQPPQPPQQTTPPPASDPWANGGSGHTPDMFAADTGDP